MARIGDWQQKPSSRISVPWELAHGSGQKKALVSIWEALYESGFNLTDIDLLIQDFGVEAILQSQPSHIKQTPKTYPKYSTAVAASFGIVSSADADAGGHEDYQLENLLNIKSPERTIFLEVTGYSMIDDGILPGAILAVEVRSSKHGKSWLDAQNGDTVIALVDESDFTVKKFRRTEEGEFLVPRNRKNKAFQPLQISSCDPSWIGGHEVEIIGIVTKICLDP